MTEYAAIDLGTNSCRMLIARPHSGGGFTVVDGFSRIVRLGENVADGSLIDDGAAIRAIEALGVCAGKLAARGTPHVRGVATEACRRALNGRAFLDRVCRETGLRIDIVSPVREAALTLSGCAPLLTSGHDRVLLFDIGGGSTEIQWVEIRRGAGQDAGPRPIDVLSLPIGVVTLSERFGPDTTGPRLLSDVDEIIGPKLRSFCRNNGITRFIADGRVQMVGTSGTVTTLGALHLGLPRYDRSRVDGLDIDFDHIGRLSASLSEMDVTQRREIPCIGPGRADLMIMGCAILSGICRRWPVGSVKVADRGIREGLLMEMIENRGSRAPGERTGAPVSSALPAPAAF